ncbi:MAG: Calx-beta domain-containing protein, partial [Myxococcota bacterium]
MVRLRLQVVLVALVLSTFGCGGGGGSEPDGGDAMGDAALDGAPMDGAALDGTMGDVAVDGTNMSDADAARDAALDATDADTGVVPPIDCDVTPDAFGCPCVEEDDCASGLCVDGASGPVCTDTCDETACPDATTCVTSDAFGPDEIRLCARNGASSCRPCESSSDCVGALLPDEDVACLALPSGGDTFCVSACESDLDCPAEYECVELDDGTDTYCAPSAGACPEPVRVRFALAGSSTADEASALAVAVVLTTDAPLAEAISVDVVDAATGTATSGADYTALGVQTLTFDAGSEDGDMQTIDLQPIDDVDVEGVETVGLLLQNVVGDGAIGAQDGHALTIVDDDAAVVEFQAAGSTGAENGGAASVPVRLLIPSGGRLAVPIEVDVTDAGSGTATAADYASIGVQTLTFGVGAMNGATRDATITPSAMDNLVEGDETIVLAVGGLTGPGALGSQAAHTFTLTDSDAASMAFMTPASATTDESTALPITVVLTTTPPAATLASAASATVQDEGTGTATSGADYAAFGAPTVAFAAGAGNGATATVTVTPIDDGLIDLMETVALLLASPSAPLTVRSPSTHQVTITDDDASVPMGVADVYQTVGNTGLHATAGAALTPLRHPNGVLANDVDPVGAALMVTSVTGNGAPDVSAPFTVTTAMGGDVVMMGSGEFTYYPPAGVTSTSDTFTYVATNGDASSTAITVTVEITDDLVYYVDPTVPAGGTGRDDARFDSLADVPSTANATVYVFPGSVPGAITLANGMQLVGAGGDLTFNVDNALPDPDVLFSGTTRPTLTALTTAASGNTIRDLNYNSSNRALSSTAAGVLTVQNVDVTVTGGVNGIQITNAAPGSVVNFGRVSISGTTTIPLNLSLNAGTFTFGNTTLRAPVTGTGLQMTDNTGSFTFGNTEVTSPDSDAVVINSGSPTVVFNSLTSTSPNQSALDVRAVTGGALTITNALTVVGSGQSAVFLSNFTGTTTIGSVSIDNSTSNGTGIQTENSGLVTINADNDTSGGAINAGSG